MAGSPWSSSSSCTSSFGSIDDDVVCVIKPDSAAAAAAGNVKFLCSYGGRILPRHSDGALRYVGGHNRVLSVDRSLQFYELQRRLREMCGWENVSLRCQLPTEDLDALVSVTSDDDLANLLEEYDAASKDRLEPLKIRAFLFPPLLAPSTLLPRSSSPSTPLPASTRQLSPPINAPHQLHRQNSSRVSPTCAPRWWVAPPQATARPAARSAAGSVHQPQLARSHRYLVHNGSHWQ